MRAISLLIALTACQADKESTPADGTSDDTASSSIDDPMDFALEVTMSEKVSTVGTLEWSMSGTPSAAWVEFGIEDYEHSVEVDVSAGDTWEALLLGMKADHDYDVRVRATVDGTEYTSNPVTARCPAPRQPGQRDFITSARTVNGMSVNSIRISSRVNGSA